MKMPLVTAAVLAVLTAAAHSVLGERLLVGPLLRRDDLPGLLLDAALSKNTLRFVWHLPSVAWCGFAVLLATYSGTSPEGPLTLHVIAATALVSALLTAAVSRGRHPGWLAFVGIATLTWFAI